MNKFRAEGKAPCTVRYWLNWRPRVVDLFVSTGLVPDESFGDVESVEERP
jgi:hypothetical protein